MASVALNQGVRKRMRGHPNESVSLKQVASVIEGCPAQIAPYEAMRCRYDVPPSIARKDPGYENMGLFKLKRHVGSNRTTKTDVIQNGNARSQNILGFSELNPSTSFGLFQKAAKDIHPQPADYFRLPTEQLEPGSDWYKSFLRQLPSTTIIENLVSSFFESITWPYSPLDRSAFTEQKSRWESLNFASLAADVQSAPSDVHFFPAILFQVLALSLLYRDSCETGLECIKYAPSMTLDNIAHEYSAAGVALSAELSKHCLSLSAIQAGFLRTLFLKTAGRVVESWQSLGNIILDSRKLQWHLDPPGKDMYEKESPAAVYWARETRRTTWLNICCWDAHMSTMLGHPMRITTQDIKVTLPVDTALALDRAATLPIPRTQADAPTRLTIQLVNHQIAQLLLAVADIHRSSDDDDQIQALHDEIMDFYERLPAFLWADRPDCRFDSNPECFWLPDARESIEAAIWFSVMALHRPLIFQKTKSRVEALKAGLRIIRAERRAHSGPAVKRHRSFSYLFSAFDAAATISAIYVLFPQESPRKREEAIQCVDIVMQRFKAMSSLNPLADTALSILRALYTRLPKAIGGSSNSPSLESLSSSHPQHSDQSYPRQAGEAINGGQSLSAEEISTLLPLRDMLFNNLSGTRTTINELADSLDWSQSQSSDLDWTFHGDFNTTSFWNFINYINP